MNETILEAPIKLCGCPLCADSGCPHEVGGSGGRMSNLITGKQMWEILVPASDGRGTLLLVNFHRIWDEKVRDLTGGG